MGALMGRKVVLSTLSAMIASLFGGMQHEVRHEGSPPVPTTPTVVNYKQRPQRSTRDELKRSRWKMQKQSRKKNYARNGTRG